MFLYIYSDTRYFVGQTQSYFDRFIQLVKSTAFFYGFDCRFMFPNKSSIVFRFHSDVLSSDVFESRLVDLFSALHSVFPEGDKSNICPFTSYRQFNYLSFTFQLKQKL